MPRKREDLTGKVFNKLTVVECLGPNEKSRIMWKCKCECGGEIIVQTANLKNGGTKSCGCLRRSNREDLTGKVFGMLTVIEYEGLDETKKYSIWKCKCECGNEKSVKKTNLKRGFTWSCGCVKKVVSRKEDLTGQVFGMLTVIEYMGLDETGKFAMWKCKCECGGEIITRKHGLKDGTTKACGCLQSANKYKNEDLTGQVFGRLTVIEFAGIDKELGGKSGASTWKCKCECGEVVVRKTSALKGENVKSCGCLAKEHRATFGLKHGLSTHPLYGVWSSMRERCNNPNAGAYKHYGGRGIKVFEEWNESFEAFYRDMIEGYEEGLTIERKDVNGDYTPENCTWATRMEQANNTRATRHIQVFGEKLSIAQAARKYNMHRNTLDHRLSIGMSPEEAVTIPVQEQKGRNK